MPSLLSLFRKPQAPVSRLAIARVPEGQRVYAIGDVHGRFDLLIGLLKRIKIDSEERGEADTHVVLLGDLIDRGPHSAQVLEYLRSHRDIFATFHFIAGNHEEAMLATLGLYELPMQNGWLNVGGRETLCSYGADPASFRDEGLDGAALIRRHVPRTHLDFLESFEESVRIGDYLFVHAGIRPGVAIEQQRGDDMRWIRRDFLDDERDHGVVVVHGHSITAEPDIRHNRIGIDTGAYKSGMLTALALEGEDRWLMMEQA
ncbi:MAG: metallophosphoesterase family protein [Sphingomonadaceae bacterium]